MAPIEQPVYVTIKKGEGTMGTAKSTVETKAEKVMEMVLQCLKDGKGRATIVLRDPQTRTITISSAGGAIVMGTAGGALGTASGLFMGSVAGAVPALFTFGLSLPIGAVLGAGSGLCVGTAAGTCVGAVGGGAAGFGGYKYRVELQDGLVSAQKKALRLTMRNTKAVASLAVDTAKENAGYITDVVKKGASAAGQYTKEHAHDIASLPRYIMADDRLKVTAATATAGATVGGGSGVVVGAALGLIPALFTFGLSIPVGALVGGVVGTTSGTAGGAVIGYGGYTYRSEIRSCAETIKNEPSILTSKVSASAMKISEAVRFVSGAFTDGMNADLSPNA